MQTSVFLLAQLSLDVACYVLGQGHGSIAVDNVAFLVDQELGEVPLDGVAQQPAFLTL